MIIKPRVRGFLCITTHPTGCEANVSKQINYVKANGTIQDGPKRVLVIGASTGYGLASRISAFLKKKGLRKSPAQQVGITPQLFTSLPKQMVYTLKVLMVMPLVMKSNKKRLRLSKPIWVR